MNPARRQRPAKFRPKTEAPGVAEAAPGLAPRAVAAQLLAAVLDRRTPLDAALESDAGLAALEPRDRALARAIVGTALRRLGTIDAVLAALVEKQPPKAGALMRILQTAAAQVLFLEVADHAAVSIAIDLVVADRDARHFKGLANAVLRRLARDRHALLAANVSPGRDTPPWLFERWQRAYGPDTAAAIAAAHALEPALDISVKSDPAGWAEKFGGIVLPTGTVRAVVAGPIEDLPGFAEGAWWIQDAAAALPARLLGDIAGRRVADLCAAPGGKTAALCLAGARVTAVDVSQKRLGRLRENLARLGLTAETVAADVTAWQPDAPFDAILLDAPCTATGTIRRHPDVAWLKRPEDVAALAAVQSRMLAAAARLLAPGGTLVFCTCSLEPEEGEAHVAEIAGLGLTLAPIRADEVGGMSELVTSAGMLRTLPGHMPGPTGRLSGMDGFFVMRMTKDGNSPVVAGPSKGR